MRTYLIGNPSAALYKPTSAPSYYNYSGYNFYGEDKWSYNTGKTVYGGYGAALKKDRDNDDLENKLEDALDDWMKVLDDIELTGGWYMLDCLAEDAQYHLSSTAKSLVIVDGWTTYHQEMIEVSKAIDVNYGDGGGNATIEITKIEEYIQSMKDDGFAKAFDKDGDWA